MPAGEDFTVSAIAIEFVVILVLLVANGLFSMAEIALVSARKSRLRKLAAEGDTRARVALELAESPNRFLSTVQVGITLVGVFTGAYAGATLSRALADLFRAVPALSGVADAVALGSVVLVLTVLSVVLGELVPKRIALNSPLAIALAFARPMNRISRMASPVVHLLSALTDGVLRVVGFRPKPEPPVTAENVRSLVEQGQRAGVFHQTERDLFERVLALGDRRVGEMMTPRARIIWLNVADPDQTNWLKIAAAGHSYYPVYEGQRDHVIGLLAVKALWAGHALGAPQPLRELIAKPLIVPTSMTGLKLLETFKQSRQEQALVTDEFGTVQGLVTLVDVLEEIAGDFPVFDVPLHQRVTTRPDGSWLMDGSIEIHELKKLLGVERLPGEDDEEFQTLGGFLIAQLQRIPREGEYFDWDGFRFEVADMDRHRVDKILVQRRPDAAAAPILTP